MAAILGVTRAIYGLDPGLSNRRAETSAGKQDGQDRQDGMLHEDLTEKIIGACFEVMPKLEFKRLHR